MEAKEKERQYRPGERVPGTEYVVIRLEAEGGHGALYLVRHHFLEKKIQMLKTLRSFEPSKDLIERLKREAQMLAAMDHPHIVSVTSGGLTDEKDPRPYFVMERLKGRSLAQILPDAPEGIGVDAALKIGIEVCDALEYVHVRHGVVHRDIKPDNIFLHVTPRNGSLTKILDFGVAHMMDLEKRHTKNNLFLGTPAYASPEQIMGERPSPKTDLYAVGLVLYELLLGHGPFDDAQTFAAVATAHVQLAPPPFPKNRRFPQGLEPLVMSLLAKAPADRPRSAEWLATQLRQIKRIAELAEHVQSATISHTDVSPVQNILTAHRAQLTEAGAPTAPPSEPVPSAPPTVPAPYAERDTLRLAVAEPTLSAVDRAAETRSLQVELPEPKRIDTEPVSEARGWLPPGAPGHGAAPAGGPAAPAPLEQTATSTNAAVELTAGAEGRKRRWAAVGGVAGGLAVVGLAVAIYARSDVAEGEPTPGAASALAPTESAPPMQAAAAPPTAMAPSRASDPPNAPVPPATAPPVPSASGAAASVPAPPVTTQPPPPRARPAPPKPVLKLPASGL